MRACYHAAHTPTEQQPLQDLICISKFCLSISVPSILLFVASDAVCAAGLNLQHPYVCYICGSKGRPPLLAHLVELRRGAVYTYAFKYAECVFAKKTK